MVLGWKIKAISLPQKGFHTTYLEQTQLALLLFSFLCTHPSIPRLALPFIPSLLHSPFCTALNHFVFTFQRDAGGNGLQLRAIKANKTRLNLSVEVVWLEGIAGINGRAAAPNTADTTAPLCFKIP